MRIEQRGVAQALGTVLMQNVVDADGKRVQKKGTWLTQVEVDALASLPRPQVLVGVLGDDDVHEDEAAVVLATALRTSELELTAPAAGRVNLRSRVDGLLELDAERLLDLNSVPGIALATRRQHALVGPNQQSPNVCTLKIIPYAVNRRDLDRARALAEQRPGIIEVRPLPMGRRVAMLLVGEAPVHDWLRDVYLPPTRSRLERLGAELVSIEAVPTDGDQLEATAGRLSEIADLIIIASQTSITHDDDPILDALRRAGAEGTLSGAPVEPGNLLALAYLPRTPVLCLPGCARGTKRNVVDLVLPRLLMGERLGRREIATLGLGGFLTAAERAGDLT